MKDLNLTTPTPNTQHPTPILVTGADGQLGLTIQELYAGNSTFDFRFTSKSELDITNKREIEFFFEKYKFDYCINCAAYTNVEQAEKTPDIAYKVNAEAVKNLAEACKETNTVLVHISTDYVFDGEKKEPYKVTDLPNPINEYGKSKLLGEQHIQNTLSKYFIIRTSWLYSKKYGKNFYKSILEKAKVEKNLFITNTQKGCPTDTENLAEFIYKLIVSRNDTYGIYHFCDEKVMTWYDFAKQVLHENNILKLIKLVKSNNYRTFAKRPINSVLIKSKLP
ncbi:dTDP-4-dehydrorhamnose reductase [Mariniflexile rhizosphaerae]|uniref:dTDP-4-dehydrorhamnose reductase n=1 Tax=unclassified Mariniflexile TaxID=2643887 RepID=UPI000CB867A1|nr:dTDP-4-dehydrorhamnose reductase [Mariniflexile sp. TRM1-10]AXP80589.1 dTDP-4-dehydrorhamnose reductase [Mariniflexile sp. TRM1-10]PLB20134.1 MAG: dTDP-4-dehydrorhamnose reductase [Flavobacteriaceae bacterium FS1-H7996/R]